MLSAKVAVTVCVALKVTVQAPVPVQSPPQPAKVEPMPAAAANVTAVPSGKVVAQVAPQVMPEGVEVIAPVPLPNVLTVSTCAVPLLSVKMALTFVAAVTKTVQAPVPEHAPPQPPKVDPLEAAAVSVTWVPWSYEAEQVAPQSMPAGVEVTAPAPLPVLLTVSTSDVRSKVAVTLCAWLSVTVQLNAVAEHAPPQLLKVEPMPGVAVSVTEVPSAKSAAQVAPQSMPEGEEAMVPVPLPSVLTISVRTGIDPPSPPLPPSVLPLPPPLPPPVPPPVLLDPPPPPPPSDAVALSPQAAKDRPRQHTITSDNRSIFGSPADV